MNYSASTVALLLERDPLVRERATKLLESEGFSVCAVADPSLFRSIAAAIPPALVILGVPDMDDLPDPLPAPLAAPVLLLAPAEDRRLCTHLRVRWPEARIADRSLREPDTIRGVLEGRPATSPLEGDSGWDPVRRAFAPFGLSERQLEVAGLALLGQSSLEIARALYVSELTIRNHLHAIYERVGVSGRRELSGRFVRGLLAGNA